MKPRRPGGQNRARRPATGRPAFGIGVDGGASKTECILVDGAGAIVARHLAPGCSPSVLGAAESARVVRRALAGLLAPLREKPRIGAILLCMAGNRSHWRKFASSLKGFGRAVAVDDSLPVLELATGGGPGLVLHGGTGSFVAARTGPSSARGVGPVHYAGGLGWRFGDSGSGHDLGRRAVARALLELQGWAPPSGLGALVRRSTGLRDSGEVSRYYYTPLGPDPRVAGLAPGVLRLARAGDRAARAIVRDSTAALCGLAETVAARLFPGQRLSRLRAGLSGPILTDPTVAGMMRAGSRLSFRVVGEPPIEGVRRLLQKL